MENQKSFFFKELGTIQCILLLFNEMQMICKDFSATPLLGGLFLIVNKNSILGATGPRHSDD